MWIFAVDGFEDWSKEMMYVSSGHKGWILGRQGIRTVVDEPCNPFGLGWVLCVSVELFEDFLNKFSLQWFRKVVCGVIVERVLTPVPILVRWEVVVDGHYFTPLPATIPEVWLCGVWFLVGRD